MPFRRWNEDRLPLLERASKNTTAWIGSTSSIIVHTVFFMGIFALALFGVGTDTILLVLTTIVSLEAIYLAIFIQMTVNQSMESLEEVEEDIEELEEDIEEIGEEIDEISEDIDRIQEEDIEAGKKRVETNTALDHIEGTLQKLLDDLESIKRDRNK